MGELKDMNKKRPENYPYMAKRLLYPRGQGLSFLSFLMGWDILGCLTFFLEWRRQKKLKSYYTDATPGVRPGRSHAQSPRKPQGRSATRQLPR
jgi:hypothetical protein